MAPPCRAAALSAALRLLLNWKLNQLPGNKTGKTRWKKICSADLLGVLVQFFKRRDCPVAFTQLKTRWLNLKHFVGISAYLRADFVGPEYLVVPVFPYAILQHCAIIFFYFPFAIFMQVQRRDEY